MFGWFRQARRLSELEERLEKAERGLASAQLDWDELYEKMRRLMGRVTKRAAVVEEAEAEETMPQDNADRISAQIRARRRGIRSVEG